MDLEHYDEDEDGEGGEMNPDEEAEAHMTSDDADICFKKHSGMNC